MNMENMCMAFENRCLGYTTTKPKLPLLLVTGFLGSGKTTLLRHLLCNKSNLRMAVLVNELGTIDIDGALLKSTDINAGLGICTQELTNGCVCCTVKDDLRRAVLQVLERRETVDYLVIETSGAADPRPVAATLAQLCRLDLVVTVIDGTAAAEHAQVPLFHHQLVAADLVLLNKCDLLEDLAVEEAQGIIAGATTAKVVRTSHGQVPLDLLMDLQVQAQSKGADTADGFLSHDGTCGEIIYTVGGRPHFHDKTRHQGFERHDAHSDGSQQVPHEGGHLRTVGMAPRSRSLATVAVTCSDAPVSLSAFERFVARLTSSCTSADAGKEGWGRIWRVKGFVWCAEARKVMYEFHLSGARRVDVTEDGAWKCEPKTQLVVIGDNVDAVGIQVALQQCQTLDVMPAGDMGGARDRHAVEGGKEDDTVHRDVLGAIRSDPNFEVWPSQGSEQDADGAVGADVGEVLVSLKETDEMRLHGVYARNLNREIISAVNARRAPLLLLPVTPPGAPDACVYMMLSLNRRERHHGGDAEATAAAGCEADGGWGVAERWSLVRNTAYKTLEAKCIARCKCGF